MKIILTALTILLPGIMMTHAQASLYLRKQFTRGNDTLRYRIMYPAQFNPAKKYPLLLFLHGAGERGANNQSQLRYGGSLFVDSAARKNFPAIVVFPQCAPNDYWAQMHMIQERTDSTPQRVEYLKDVPPGKSLQLVMELLDSLSREKFVDGRRIYVGGVSMGARGTFEILWRKPNFFAAAFAIAGGGNPSTVSGYARKFPIWIFHGDQDNVVDVNDSRTMAEALTSAGAAVIYTEYPGVQHNAWDYALAEKNLLPWIFSKKRK